MPEKDRKTPEEGDGVETALPLDVLSLEVGYELIRARLHAIADRRELADRLQRQASR